VLANTGSTSGTVERMAPLGALSGRVGMDDPVAAW
jgi:hypothetical protein